VEPVDEDITFTRTKGQVPLSSFHFKRCVSFTNCLTTLFQPQLRKSHLLFATMADKLFSDSFTFLPQGGIIQEFKIAGTNVVLGFPSAESYRSEHTPFFGENIGRVANRISGAKINSLNGKSYDLTANEGRNTLHGGAAGWGKQNFEGPTPVNRNGKESVLFKYLSKDGDEGFPGTVELRLWYVPSIEKVDGVEKTSLEIEYEVELVGDEVEETVVAVTNHRYAIWNILTVYKQFG
jgi:aldose 1-epimerase